VRFVNSKPLDDLALHGIIEFVKTENGVPEHQTSGIKQKATSAQIWPSSMEVTIWEGGQQQKKYLCNVGCSGIPFSKTLYILSSYVFVLNFKMPGVRRQNCHCICTYKNPKKYL
jgi:hypothetical protein